MFPRAPFHLFAQAFDGLYAEIQLVKIRQILVGLVAVMLLAGLLHEAQASHDNFCYVVADAGGGAGGNDLLTQVGTTDFNPATNETNIGTGTGTSTMETIAFQAGPGPGTVGPLYAADAGQLGTLSLTTGIFTSTSSTFGIADGALGSITFRDVDGLAFDTFSGTLYGSHRRGGAADDLLIQINPSTGAHIPDALGAGIDYVVISSFSVVGLGDIDDISINPSDGLMYASANDVGTGDRLVRIDVSNGAVTDIPPFGVDDIEGLSFDDSGQLWGTTGTAALPGEQNSLYEISLTTGAASRYAWVKAILHHVAQEPPPRLVPTLSEERPTYAERPGYSALDCTKLEQRFGIRLPDWRDDLSLALSARHLPDFVPAELRLVA